MTVNQAVDIGTEVKRMLASPLSQDPRLASLLDHRSPVTAAAFAYAQNLPNNNDICGKVKFGSQKVCSALTERETREFDNGAEKTKRTKSEPDKRMKMYV